MNKILVVDDDIYIRELIATLLRNEGYIICEAADGRERAANDGHFYYIIFSVSVSDWTERFVIAAAVALVGKMLLISIPVCSDIGRACSKIPPNIKKYSNQ